MKIILLEDVKSLGKKDDIVEINDGYARNMIIPKKKGVEATPKNLNDLKLKKQSREKLAATKLAEAKALATSLESKTLKMAIRTGTDGRSFGSISTKEIAEVSKQQLELELDKKKIQLDAPIKNVGSYTVRVKLHPQVVAPLKIIVEEKKC